MLMQTSARLGLEEPLEYEAALEDIRRESRSPENPELVVLRLAVRHSWGTLNACLLQLHEESAGEAVPPMLALVMDVGMCTSEQSQAALNRAFLAGDERRLALYALGLPTDEDKRRALMALDALPPRETDYDGVLAQILRDAMQISMGPAGGSPMRRELQKTVLGILLKLGKIDTTELEAFLACESERPRFRPFVAGH